MLSAVMPDLAAPPGLLAFVVALCLSLALNAVLIRWAPRLGLVDLPDPRKVHSRPTPRAGGLAIFAAFLVAALLPSQPWPSAAVPLALVGLPVVDALSAGTAAVALTVLMAAGGDAHTGLGLLGAVLGFLWFNRPPARLFMGDAGSTFLGFAVGVGTARLAMADGAPPWSPLAALAVCAVPCYDLTSVVLIRLREGRSPFHADKRHLSHRFVARGLRPPWAVCVIHMLALASGVCGLLLYNVRDWPSALLAFGQLALWWAALALTEWATRSADTSR
jgi:UDP-N-acetylmuramyl pentapeptide phosphotransferase/UDP-N-acetylglucosamine-1-phosphate transferase